MALPLLLFAGLFERGGDDLEEHLFHFLDRKALGELIKSLAVCPFSVIGAYLSYINFLDLQIIQHVGQGLKRSELSGANVLLALER